MTESAAAPAGGAHLPDLSDFAKVLEAEGPFLTVMLDTQSNIDNASHRSLSAWKPLRSNLAEEGVPDQILDAVEELVPTAHENGDTLGVVANAKDGVLYTDHWFEQLPLSRGEFDTLPRLAPFIVWRQANLPYVVVLTDREGADIEAYVPGGDDIDLEVKGKTFPIRKVSAGGWSMRRYQNRAEDVWNKNAKQVADEVTRVVSEIDAPLVVLAGDVRASELLREHLPQETLARLKEIDGGRNADGSAETMTPTIRRLVQTAAAEATVTILQKFREERGQMDRYADGPRAVCAALQEAKVETLLVHEPQDDPRRGFFGPEATQVAVDEADVKELGVDAPREGRLIDVLIRAALGTGAGVRVVPHTSSSGPTDDVGAILRWK
jgi:hypothetical protein